MKTLLQRLEFLAKLDAERRGDLRPNWHEIARGANLEPGTVTMMVSRLRKGTAHSANTKTLTALAMHFRCSYEWLASGVGEPFGESSPALPPPTLPVEYRSRLSELPHYEAIERSARKLAPSVGDETWMIVREQSPFLPANTQLSAGALAEYAMLLAKFVTPKD